MQRDPLLTPSASERLVDRPGHGGAWPWRLPSLYLLAFFGGGGAAAAVSWWNARRLGLPHATRRHIAWLGAGYLVAAAALLAWIGGALVAFDPTEREAFRSGAPHVRTLLQLASLALAWRLVRLQLGADRLYQIESGGSQRYSSLWGPGTFAALASLALLLALTFAAAALGEMAA